MFRDLDGEFCFTDSGGSDDGDEFFHSANFLIFFELTGSDLVWSCFVEF